MKKIGILSFIPDAGHVIPLLRIASEFVEQQYEVICFFPEECKKYAEMFHIPMRSFGIVTQGIDPDFMNQISKQSITKFRYGGWKIIDKTYNDPIKKNVLERFHQIVDIMKEDHLSFIITDNHIFNVICKKIAASLGLPIVFHHSEGNLRYLQDELTFCYGYKGFPLLSKLKYYLIMRPYYVMLYWISLIKPSKKKAAPEKENSLPEIYISSGIAPVEGDFIKKERLSPNGKYIHFPPVRDKRLINLEKHVMEWLENDDERPVVYVSFGTMVKPSEKFFINLLKGLLMLDIRILWVASKAQKKVMKGLENFPNLLIEEFVHQPGVLSHRKVKCFVCHGGAGGIQDSLLAGKPMLCIPFTFDQPYNSSIIMLMKAGIRIKKEKVSAHSVKKAVSQILKDPVYWKSAQSIMKRFNEMDGGKAIFNYLHDKILQ